MNAEEQKTLTQTDKPATRAPHKPGGNTTIPTGVVLLIGGLVLLGVLFLVWRWMASMATDYSGNQLVSLSQMTDGTDIKALAKIGESKPPEGLPSFNSPTLRRERLMLEQLKAFVKDNPRSVEGRLARLRLARLALFLGERDSASDEAAFRDSARSDLELAREQYKQLAAECADVPTLQQEALLNQARAAEGLGQIQEAKDLYEQLSRRTDTNSPSVAEAKKQLERLTKQASTADYLFKETLGKK